MSEETLTAVQLVRRRLLLAARRITLGEIACGAAATCGIAGAAFLVSVAMEAGFRVGTLPRSIVFWSIAAVTLSAFGASVVRPALRLVKPLSQESEDAVARRIGRRYPEVADRLLNLLHLVDGRRSEAPVEMVDEAVRRLGSRLRGLPFEHPEDFAAARRAGPWASVPALGLLVFLLAAPSTFLGASKRLLSPGTEFARPAPFRLHVEPGAVDLVRGEELRITVRAEGERLPRAVFLEFEKKGEDRVESEGMQEVAASHFTYYVKNIREDFRYRAAAGPVVTEWFAARVESRPIVRRLELTLHPLAYTKLPSQRLAPNVGDVVALPGTRVALLAETGGGRVTAAALHFEGGRTDSLELSGGGYASGTFTVRREDAYRIVLTGDRGVENADPIRYAVKPLTDAYPSVVLLEPDPSAQLDADLEAPLRFRLRDDYGFSRLALFHRLAESRFDDVQTEFGALDLAIDADGPTDREIAYRWRLGPTTGLDIVPGDAIDYYVQVWDNDAWSGFKFTRSAVHRLLMPSLADRYAELAESQGETEDEMEDLVRETEAVREEFEALRDEVRRKQSADWDDNRQLRRLTVQQERLESRIDDLASSLESAIDTMDDHELASDETLEMFSELQRVMEEINSPELMEALEELQRAMAELSPRLMQESMQKFAFNEEMFRERLERSLELFKRLQVQQQLEESARRAENLAEEQKRLAEETERASGDEGERFAQEQMRSGDEMERLEERMAEIERRMQELRNAPSEEMDRLNEETREREIPEQMRGNASELRRQEMQRAQQGQRNMQRQLQELTGALEDMQTGMQGRQQQANMALLSRVLADVLHLSHDQEAVRRRAEDSAQESPVLREFAQRQIALSDGLETVTDSLRSLSQELAHMTRAVQRQAGESLRAMGEATEALADRDAPRAVAAQQRSMMHLNELALLLSDLMEQLMNAASNSAGGGMSMDRMIEQLQQMTGQQQALNRQIQDILEELHGNRMTADMERRLRQLGAQQQALREQLREMNRRRDLASRLAGDLGRIAEEMQETIGELQRGGPTPQTIRRQERILSRLLDASKSLTERGRQRNREGRRGEDVSRPGPGAPDKAERADLLRRALLEALESGYAQDYQALIRRYFELLQEPE